MNLLDAATGAFDVTIGMQALVTLLSVVAGVAVGYGSMRAVVATIRAEVVELKKVVDKIGGFDTRIALLEQTVVRLDRERELHHGRIGALTSRMEIHIAASGKINTHQE